MEQCKKRIPKLFPNENLEMFGVEIDYNLADDTTGERRMNNTNELLNTIKVP